MNASKLTQSFSRSHGRSKSEVAWIRSVFGIMIRVATRNSQFTMDDIWAHLDKAYARGALKDPDIDHRILGPMLLHMAREGVISSSQYYVKSTRHGGGSRPVTIWDSHLYSRRRVAA